MSRECSIRGCGGDTELNVFVEGEHGYQTVSLCSRHRAVHGWRSRAATRGTGWDSRELWPSRLLACIRPRHGRGAQL